MESLVKFNGIFGEWFLVGLGVKFTEVCTLALEFRDIPWVQSSVKYGR
jgi:hypothetical protein